MTKDQIAHTLTQWAYENLPCVVAPRIVIVETQDVQIGAVEILIRVGCAPTDTNVLPPKTGLLP